MTTKMMRAMAAGVVLAGMSMTVVAQGTAKPVQKTPSHEAHESESATVGGAESAATHSWTADQLVMSTVHEAWVMSGRNEDKFFDMVKELAAMSAQKRGLTLPETAEAGERAGAMIKREARKDPDQLLYAVVDSAIMKTATKTGKTATAAKK